MLAPLIFPNDPARTTFARRFVPWFMCMLAAAASLAADELKFESDVRPILKAHCLDCHGAVEQLQGQLDLRLVRLMQAGGDSGPAIVPGKPDESRLLQRIKSGEMPPGQMQVPPQEIAVIERWIADGALTARPEPAEIGPGLGITAEERAYWAFQPLRRPPVPLVAGADHPVDAFLLDRLHAEGLTFGPEADRLTLIKRATFDLLGLPPTPAEIDQFLGDDEPQAFERLVDRLLASPHYGERWGRHWLDVVGYADSDGNATSDDDRPWAYKYRDWVIRAFNRDKPLNEFIIEQLAGDELLNGRFTNLSPDEIECLTATGFLRMVKDGTSGAPNAEEARNAVVNDTVKMAGSSLLGLTIGCAQCHDHRYDPISQIDYYRFRAVFDPALNWRNWPGRLQSLYTDADRAAAAAIEAEVAQLSEERDAKTAQYIEQARELELAKHPEELRQVLREASRLPRDKRSPEQQQLIQERPSLEINPGNLYQYLPQEVEDLKALDARMTEMRSKKPVEEFLLCVTEPSTAPPETHVFHRGDYRQPQETVTPAMLEVTAPDGESVEFPVADGTSSSTGRRLALAQHLVSGRDPLCPRVLANRIWMHHFGRGLVGTPGDFGRLGDPPTHPDLLDWLAAELLEPGGAAGALISPGPRPGLKRFHRLLMTSAAYRQSSARRPELDAIDPDNRFLGRMSVRRLAAEALRDRFLAAAGGLHPDLFGKPIPIAEDSVGQVIVNDVLRRSIYIQQKRSKPESLLRVFDAPVMECNCERRPSSTVAPQALILMNSEFLLQQAAALAQRSRREARRDGTGSLDASQLPSRADTVWQLGYGSFDATLNRTQSFQPFSHWTGSQWQGGPALPDAEAGWALLHAGGGHTGNDLQHAAIRRWTAPAAGIISISGSLNHPSENGDGVRSRVVSSRSGLAGEWTARQSTVETLVATLVVETGDTLDFITDCRESVTSDSFAWSIQIRLRTPDGRERSWDADKSFPGPEAPPLADQIAAAWRIAYLRPVTESEFADVCQFFHQQFATLTAANPTVDPELQALTDLCQILLSSNEFLYVD